MSISAIMLLPLVAFFVIYLVAVFFKIGGLVACIVYVARRRNRQRMNLSRIKPNQQPHVTIIKPIHGYDGCLEQNLQSFMDLDYPSYEIHFCLESGHDSLEQLCQKFKKLHPNKVKIHMLDTNAQETHQRNPKINNMWPGWRATTSELVWMNDSKVFVEPDTLAVMVAELQHNNAACVHGMPLFKRPAPLTVEKVYFFTHHASHYVLLNLAIESVLVGQSVLVKRSRLERFGGFVKLSKYIPEDYFICKFLRDQGDKLVLSTVPVLQNVPEYKSAGAADRAFQQRMHRWYKMRQGMIPGVTLIEPFLECLPSAIYGSIAMCVLAGYFSQWQVTIFGCGFENFPGAGRIFMLHLLVWYLVDAVQATILGADCFSMGYCTGWVKRHFICVGIYLRYLPEQLWSEYTEMNWGDKTFIVKAGRVVIDRFNF